ncbi:cryptochrome/photolyase family protein [Actinoalloteichus hymeniacidonis]|uniref:Deoxyribodipyrimidine photolyase n=1 Tax=Actinoalloteichus hymeniacidonis TaxID=340345 RepID=A0AAC9HUT5_9PSEU|nr:deoxyribodipyrimidine photo-lyase [Actinoalloteichus hymeniacidonis]AOS65798.1 deoxyribodipyrimidine photolyase [Actinoalloteichus hymeniacidonis]MBB5906111.1 deoxyribodipyrimidine photo-lyase [Actinoalloteichus hymeniacidonis]
MVSDEVNIVWFRRDLRCGDHPAIEEAAKSARRTLALFVLDDRLLKPAGTPRRTFLARCLRALADQLHGHLLIVSGDPTEVVPEVAEKIGAKTVHITADGAPYGRRRDEAVRRRLDEQGVDLVETGTPYVIPPGRVRKPDGTEYRVFTAFYRAWTELDKPGPAPSERDAPKWVEPAKLRIDATKTVDLAELDTELDTEDDGPQLPEAGERAALGRWKEFRAGPLADYASDRDRPALDGTSRLSAYLHWGCVHPRTLLADLHRKRGDGAAAFRRELAWREFLADVLWHRPESARRNLDRRFDDIEYDLGADAWKRFDRWRAGTTGFPFVDAGMRQLAAEAWLHNRARLVVASFLIKDLHLPWWWGARHFMQSLVDGDLASNQHNWQWVAGSGTDAAPYFRVFNPVTQGRRFDPDGQYVRRHVAELRSVSGRAVHEPWKLDSMPAGYPEPMVDHGEERQEALRRFGRITGR